MSEDLGYQAVTSAEARVRSLLALDDEAFVERMLAGYEAAGRPSDLAAEARIRAAVVLMVPALTVPPPR